MTFDRRIGRYRVERALGSGAFSTVWLAQDDDLQDLVALKILADAWSRSEDARRRFVEEARALRALDGDRIVRLYELARLPDGRPYLVMEFADRGSLEDRMRFARQTGNPFSVSEVAALGIELAGCLATVHAGGIVHRDVKPSNVLFRAVPSQAREALRRTGRPAPSERMLLGDFGIARRMETDGLTHVVGSPQYMAPEQADPATAQRVDGRADVYAAGVVLYELLVGTPPGARPEVLVIDDVVEGGPLAPPLVRDVREIRGDVPPTMAGAIERAIARDPSDRYATAWEFREDLVRSLGEPVRTVPIPTWSAPIASGAPSASTRSPTSEGGAAMTQRRITTATDVLSAPAAAASAGASDAPQPALPARLGPFDACVLDALAGIALVVAALGPWRSVTGRVHVTGLEILPGRIAFAAGGALIVAAVIRWATRGAWGLRIARVISDLAGIVTLAALAMELVTSHGAIGAIVDRGPRADLGFGVPVAACGAVLAFLAAGRAKRQLRKLRFGSLAAPGPSAPRPGTPASPGAPAAGASRSAR